MDLAVAGTSIWPLREPRRHLSDSSSTGDIRLSPHTEQGEGVLLEARVLRIIGSLLHESMPGDCELLCDSVYLLPTRICSQFPSILAWLDVTLTL